MDFNSLPLTTCPAVLQGVCVLINRQLPEVEEIGRTHCQASQQWHLGDSCTYKKRNIDLIIEQVRNRMHEVTVTHLRKKHPGDGDGIWSFHLPDVEKSIQVESSLGMCPFAIEYDDMCSTDQAIAASDISEIVDVVVACLQSLK